MILRWPSLVSPLVCPFPVLLDPFEIGVTRTTRGVPVASPQLPSLVISSQKEEGDVQSCDPEEALASWTEPPPPGHKDRVQVPEQPFRSCDYGSLACFVLPFVLSQEQPTSPPAPQTDSTPADCILHVLTQADGRTDQSKECFPPSAETH